MSIVKIIAHLVGEGWCECGDVLLQLSEIIMFDNTDSELDNADKKYNYVNIVRDDITIQYDNITPNLEKHNPSQLPVNDE